MNADPVRLEQVLENLLQNARRYAPVERPIGVTVSATPDTATIAVQDEGIGIPLEDQPHVIDPFYRAGNVDKGLTSLGLGLYIAHEIVRAHRGTLSFASTPGLGSTFTMTLPLHPPV